VSLPVARRKQSAAPHFGAAWAVFWPTVIGSVLLWVGAAQADTLRAPPGAPEWQHFAADALLYLHIGGGTLGMLSGVGALLSRKGEWAHRFAGNVFFLSMLVTYAIGAGVAPFLSEGQRPNTIAGIMALYLLISGWMTVKRPENTSGRLEVFGLGVAVLVASAGGLFMYMGAHSASGTIDGSPPQAFLVFAARWHVCSFGRTQRDFAGRYRRCRARGAASVAHVLLAVHRVGLVLPRATAGDARMDARFTVAARGGTRAAGVHVFLAHPGSTDTVVQGCGGGGGGLKGQVHSNVMARRELPGALGNIRRNLKCVMVREGGPPTTVFAWRSGCKSWVVRLRGP
jgi:hypothetical protein